MVRIVRRLDRERPTPGDPGFVPLARGPQAASDWTPANPEPHEESVEVYSNCERVELLLNGKSLGSQTLPADASSRSWKVPFAPGLIEAVGRNKNAVVARHDLRTAGKAVKIILAGDRPTLSPAWDDVAYLTATIVDEQGIQVPSATLEPELKAGRLLEVLPRLRAEPMPVSILYPHRRQLSRRVRVFIDWLEALLR